MKATSTSGNWNVAVIEPNLPLTTPSKISFKYSTGLFVGVCYGNIVQQKNYRVESNILAHIAGFSNGIYAHLDNGVTWSHSRKDDDAKQTSHLKFVSGDVVTVQLDPVASTVTYIKVGSPTFVQKTSIAKGSQPAYFCAILSDQKSVSQA